MNVQVEPYQLRFLASRFSAGAQELLSRANRLESIMNDLVLGSWKGEGAHAFAIKCEVMKSEIQKSVEVLNNAIQTLNRFANQMDRVNQLRQQASMLEQQSWQYSGDSIDDLHHRQNVALQVAQIRQEAEWEANAADSQAANEFQSIMTMIPQVMEQVGQFLGNSSGTGDLDDLPEPLRSYYLRHMDLLQDETGTTTETETIELGEQLRDAEEKNDSQFIFDEIERGVKKAEDFIGGTMYAIANNGTMGLLQKVFDDDSENRSVEYQKGKVLGDEISVGLGVVAAVDGTLKALIGAGAGVLLSETGIGGVVGGTVAAEGVAEAIAGGVEALRAFESLKTDQLNLAKSEQSTGTNSNEDKSWLQNHEEKGGHLIDRHVGKTDEELFQRLAKQPKITGASTFNDLSTAEEVANSVLSRNMDKIKKWMASDNEDDLVLKYKGDIDIGRYLKRGSSEVENVKNATIILRKDSSGNFILTGYPTR